MWNLKIIDTDKALYIAIADALERDIHAGVLKHGQKMPTHRELADIIGVNVTTVTRAYKEAERRGLIAGTVGRGTYITADAGMDSSIFRLEGNISKTIEMGLVLPLYCCEPDLSGVIRKVINRKQVNRYLTYTDPVGLPEHREIGAHWIKRYGIRASGEEIVICAGAQHALNCCLSSIFEPGERVAVDYLTYPGIKTIAKALGIRLEPVQMDEEGMLPDNLECVCRRNPVKGLYVMPSVHNPTTAGMSLKRRKEIAAITERYGLTLIEDDIYSFTNPDRIEAITSMVPQNGIFIGGVSKSFYAGLRVAYVAAPKHLRSRIAQAVVNSIWMAPALNVEIASECIREGIAEKIISSKLDEITKRFELAKKHLSNYSFQGSAGNFFIWLMIPEGLTAKEVEQTGREKGINIIPADKFAVGGEAAPSAARVSLSGPDTMEELDRGLVILADILSQKYSKLDMIL